MKLNEESRQKYSDAIDKMSEGLEEMIELYNNAEEDIPLMPFEEDVVHDIAKAKRIFGEEYMNGKINTIMKELLSFMRLDEYEDPAEQNEETEEGGEENDIDGDAQS